MDSKVGPTGGKLTELLDMLQVQNINKLLQIIVPSSVRYTHYTAKYLQQIICVQETDRTNNCYVQLLGLLLMTKKAPKQFEIFYNIFANVIKFCTIVGLNYRK